MFKNFVSANVVVPGGQLPFLALTGIRGIRPYAPARVLRQFERKQNFPQVGYMGVYVIDYEECGVPYANDIVRGYIMKIPKNAASVEEYRGVSPAKNKEKGRFMATPNDESFWPLRFTQENKQITLKAHFRNYLWGPEVVQCSTIYQGLQYLGILHPIEEGSSEYQFKGECAYHINQ
ncbi:hypothetical protein HAX54_028657 [Datura stramonium]|uniref:Uncharacterized protein n=1 Tax=Datura stramonium TaxID=4076 RepID=A0ABS8V5E5_DATST|nr:hypothetical protein [Datura stramonium]